MSEEEFWLGVWKIVATVLCVITLTIGGCEVSGRLLISGMVKDGADPIAASCAINGMIVASSAVICANR